MLVHGLDGGVIAGLHPGGLQQLQVFRAIDRHRARGASPLGADLVVGLNKGRGEFVHHHSAVFPIGNLGHQGRHHPSAHLLLPQPQGFVIGLHLPHQFGVGALGFDQRQDRGRFPLGIARHQLVGDHLLLLAEGGAIRLLHAVLLHQQPAVATFPECFHIFIKGVGMVGQVHLRRGKPLHPLQGLRTEDFGEMLLPGHHLQLQVGDGGGGHHGMAPQGAQPLHMGLIAGVAGQALQGLEDVVPAHLLESPEQITGVIQHDPRIAALLNQLGDDRSHAAVALGEGGGVVVVALAAVLLHVLQVGDQGPLVARRDRGLVHVQRTGKGRLDCLQLQVGVGEEDGAGMLHQAQGGLLVAGDPGRGGHGAQGRWGLRLARTRQIDPFAQPRSFGAAAPGWIVWAKGGHPWRRLGRELWWAGASIQAPLRSWCSMAVARFAATLLS